MNCFRAISWAVFCFGLTCGVACSGDDDKDVSADASAVTDVPSFGLGDAAGDALGDDAQSADADLVCPGGPGCPCEANEDCDAALCLEGADGKRCGKPCVDTCDKGYLCAQVPQGSDVVTVCVDAWARLCSPCSKSEQCNHPGVTDARCVDRGAAGAFCGVACAADADCPTNHACQDLKDVDGADTKQCMPVDSAGELAACSCSKNAVSLALKSNCSKTAALGDKEVSCNGEVLCKQTGEEAVCMAIDPTPETCDGVDSDCDGETDEAACDDNSVCTTDSCEPTKGCAHAAVNDGASCDADGSVCTEGDSCTAGKCKAGAAKVCDDQNPCTTDTCDPVKGCMSTTASDETPCDPGGTKWCMGGKCEPKADKGQPCKAAKECASGFCVEGVCCDGACDSGCDSCLSKHTGGSNGQCKPVKAGEDPGDDCANEAASTCGLTGVCDGAGKCAKYKAGAECKAASCAAGSFTSAGVCGDKGCEAGKTSSCDDKNPCTTDTCDAAKGCVNTAVKDETSCSADNTQWCKAGKCVSKLQCGPGVAYKCFKDGTVPSAAQLTKHIAKNAANDDVAASSVAMGKDRALIGIHHDDWGKTKGSGSVRVVELQADGKWKETAIIWPKKAHFAKRFGHAVALDKGRAVMGAYGDWVDKKSGVGAAYVYDVQPDGTWKEGAQLFASDRALGDLFGYSVGVSGDRAIAGAFRDDDKGKDSGSAYIFERQADGKWKEITKLVPADGAGADNFGYRVAISGDTAMVASPFDDDKGSNSGAVYVYERQKDGAWKSMGKLLSTDAKGGHQFGLSVSISGNTAAIGSMNSKTVYVFNRQATGGWKETAKLKHNKQTPFVGSDFSKLNWSWFGVTVSISGDQILVGACKPESQGFQSVGAAFLFKRAAPGTWAQVVSMFQPKNVAYNGYAGSIGIHGNQVIIGHPRDNVGGNSAGAAYLFAVNADCDKGTCVCKDGYSGVDCSVKAP